MAKRPVFITGILAAICIVAGLVFINAYLSPSPQPVQQEEKKGEKSRQELLNEAEVVAQDVELVQGKKGAMEWKLLAKTAKYNQEEKLVGVTDPRLTAYYGKDRREVFISADKGEIDQANDNLTLYDNVSGRFGRLDITAPHLYYDGKDDKVFLTGSVKVWKPELNLTADEATIDLESRVLEARGHVKATLLPAALKGETLKQ